MLLKLKQKSKMIDNIKRFFTGLIIMATLFQVLSDIKAGFMKIVAV